MIEKCITQAIMDDKITEQAGLDQCFSTAGPRPGTGLIKKGIYQAAVWQRLRTTALDESL
jgi:hypothetical protein